MGIHQQDVAKTNQRFNGFHRKLKLKLFVPLALLVIALPLVWLNFNTKALASSGTECQYVPTWLIEVKSGQSKTSKFFSGWPQVEPMLAYVEQQSLPSPGQHITLTISDGGLCFDGSSTVETAASTKCPASTMPTSGPTWNVTICNLNGLLLHQEYTHWWQRFAALDAIAQHSDTHPVYGDPGVLTYTDLTVTGQ